ncbi:TIGR02221 family CRISPR-associated protein [Chloroflexus aggregans]|uniref:CRISPR-associated protein, TM1812 family n=1 Tax=Chloroflexus aggregans (strain MD-66 / DSM 9485) TaxID=326427 RepID=B8G721_CHLAD|nr:TIGR02221 family CRISPR-associated protein [Chloroflexus aggregans]ACL23978.1 CRISPR-associated protein, TM1812 family [Chloroflexus aggregans DSM 9485]
MKAITFLGARPQETCYVFPDGCEHVAPFFGLALAQYLPDLDFVVFTTELTAQFYHQYFASAQAASIQAVRIPDGRDDAELWRIFQAVVDVIEPNAAVVFDITHGFRSLPFLSFLAAAYLRKVKSIQLKHVFFGNFEMRDQSVTPHRTPVLDLTNFVELLDWMVGADLFVRFGDARDLATLLHTQHNRGKPDPKTASKDEMAAWNNSPIKATAKNLTKVSKALRVVRPADAMQASAQIMQQLPAVEHEIGTLAVPFMPLAQQIIDNFRPIALGKTEQVDPLRILQTELNLVGWYLDRGQVFQAVALAREWLVSWVMVQLGKSDILEKAERQLVEQMLGEAVQAQRGGTGAEIPVDLNAIPSLKEVINLYNQLGDLRNDLMHAGKRKQPQGAQRVEECAKRLYESLQNTCRLPS